MRLDAITCAGEEIFQNLQHEHEYTIQRSTACRKHVRDSLQHWSIDSHRTLVSEFPFQEASDNFSRWQEKADILGRDCKSFSEAIDSYEAYCKSAKQPFDRFFWDGQIQEHKKPGTKTGKRKPDPYISSRLLLSKWEISLDKHRAEWEIARLENLREEIFRKLREFLELIEDLDESLSKLGLDSGILFDLSKGSLSDSDIVQFQRWAKYLAEDEGIKELCDLLGKMRQIALSEKIEKIKTIQSLTVHLPDINSREEIVGIRLGRDLEYVLPSELALLSDMETGILFDLKYVESRLMCFDMQGMQKQQTHIEIEEDSRVTEQEKLGPMIICVDTSGSMNGTPETIAKAVVLFIASKAKEQKRLCYLINFSTGIEALELGGDCGMTKLIKFLKKSFHGGTDVAPAIAHALNVMKKEEYEKADLLIISDFIMSSLPDTMQEEIESQRVNGNSFYSLVVGSCYMDQRLKSLFDHEWVYNPKTSCIQELISFQQRMELNDGALTQVE